MSAQRVRCIMMGGFEYSIIEEPEKVKKLEKALDEFWIWQNSTKTLIDPEDGFDVLRITKYHIYKSIEDYLFPYTEKSAILKNILEEDEIKQIKKGKWMVHWYRIFWIYRWNEMILPQLARICKKHSCLWFLEDMIFQGEERERIAFNALENILKNRFNLISNVPRDEGLK